MSRQGRAQSRTAENVRDFWNKEADEWGANPQVTIRDHYFRLLELGVIRTLIRGRRKVLDIGCGTGFSTLFYSQEVAEIIGADYAASMVARARQFLENPSYFQETMRDFAPGTWPDPKGNIRFEEANVLAMPYPAATFDAVVAERVLINLPETKLQDDAIREVARVLDNNGRWVSVEVTQQGHETVDRCRQMFGLSIIEKYWHNLYVDEPHFEAVVKTAGFNVSEIVRFETFHFLTKVVHPLVVAPAEPKFLAGFNKAAWQVSLEFPTFTSVSAIGLERFLRERFRPLLAQHDPEKLDAYDGVVTTVAAKQPDFNACSHQVLYVLDKREV